MSSGKGWAWAGFLLGTGVSVAGNVGHTYYPAADVLAKAGVPAQNWHPTIGAQAVAAFFPIALLVTVEILARAPWPSGWGWATARFGGAALVASVAAVVSYLHLYGLLTAYGETSLTATIGPLAVDGLMVVSGFALLAISVAAKEERAVPPPVPETAAGTGTPSKWQAWWRSRLAPSATPDDAESHELPVDSPTVPERQVHVPGPHPADVEAPEVRQPMADSPEPVRVADLSETKGWEYRPRAVPVDEIRRAETDFTGVNGAQIRAEGADLRQVDDIWSELDRTGSVSATPMDAQTLADPAEGAAITAPADRLRADEPHLTEADRAGSTMVKTGAVPADEVRAPGAYPDPDPHQVRAATVFAEELADGEVPSVRRIKREMRIGQDKAREVRVYLNELVEA